MKEFLINIYRCILWFLFIFFSLISCSEDGIFVISFSFSLICGVLIYLSFKKSKYNDVHDVEREILAVFLWRGICLFIICGFTYLTFSEHIFKPLIFTLIFCLLLWKSIKNKKIQKLRKLIQTYNEKGNDIFEYIIYCIYNGENISDIFKGLGLDKEQMLAYMKRIENEEYGEFDGQNHFTIHIDRIYPQIIHNRFYINAQEEQKAKQEIEEQQRIDDTIEKHLNTLARKYKQLSYTDDYDEIHTEDFDRELNYFIDNVLFKEKEIYLPEKMKYFSIISNKIKNIVARSELKNTSILPKNPYDFEKHCADILCQNGWKAKATQKSSDQGIDVIATKDGITVALQCKLYSKPVGNKAVQEAFSGKAYYEADYAGVVTNNTFTKSARQLANNCNILLLNPDDLESLDDFLK